MRERRLSEVLTSGVIGVPATTAVFETIRIMRRKNISFAVQENDDDGKA